MDTAAVMPSDHVMAKWFNENKCNQTEPFRIEFLLDDCA